MWVKIDSNTLTYSTLGTQLGVGGGILPFKGQTLLLLF